MGSPYTVTVLQGPVEIVSNDAEFDRILQRVKTTLCIPQWDTSPECFVYETLTEAFCKARESRTCIKVYLEPRYDWYGGKKFCRTIWFDFRTKEEISKSGGYPA